MALIGLGLFAHALLLLNDGIFLDDWFVWLQVFENDWAGFRRFWRELGHDHLIPFYEFLYRNPGTLFIQSVIQLASVILAAISLFIVFNRNLGIPAGESWFAAALFLTWPFFWISVHHLTMHYVMGMGLFCLGWALYLNWNNVRREIKNLIVFLILGLAMYTYNSLLVFYFGFVLIAWYDYHKRRDADGKWHTSIARFLRERWFLLIFPFLVYALKRVLSPPIGMQANYNELIVITHSPGEAFSLFISIFLKNLVLPIREIGRIVRQFLFPWFWLVVIAGMTGTWCWRRSRPEGSGQEISRYDWLNWKLAMIAAVLLALSIVPYAMVGKRIYAEWGYRHSFLMSIPYGILAVLMLSGAMKAFPKLPHWSGTVMLSGFLVFFAATCIYKYNQMLVRWTLDRATIESLKDLEPPAPGTFLFFDTFFNISTDVYRRYEVAGLVYSAWDRLDWYTFHQRPPINSSVINKHLQKAGELGIPQKWMSWGGVPRVNPNGCAAILRLIPSKQAKSPWLGIKYLLIQFSSPKDLKYFLGNILEVRINPIPSSNCQNSSLSTHG